MKHIVGFSGGVDSQACARWVLNRFDPADVILVNTNAGRHESPITTAFVREYSETVFPVTVVVPEMRDLWKTEGWAEKKGIDGSAELTFVGLAKHKKRFPSRTAQFCTEFLKLRPMRRWSEETLGDEEIIRYSGVRRDESNARAMRPVEEYDKFFDCILRNPIVDWTKQMAFDYAKAHKEPVNPLYSLGFTRVGCAPCVNAGKEDIRAWADRAPEIIDRVRDYEREVGITFFAPMVPGIALRPSPRSGKMEAFNWIDEVVEWSRTDHGGKQFNILKTAGLERPNCESKFGLCE